MGERGDNWGPLPQVLALTALVTSLYVAQGAGSEALQLPHPQPWGSEPHLDEEWSSSEWRHMLGAGESDRVLTYPPSADPRDGVLHFNHSLARVQCSANSSVVRRALATMKSCNYAQGSWVQDRRQGPRYTGQSCRSIRGSYNCMNNGRKDKEYFSWKWKPAGCALPTFNAHLFLSNLRDSVVGFVGDSIGRNLQQSVACQLSQSTKVVAWKGYLGKTPVTGDYYPLYKVWVYTVASPYFMSYASDVRSHRRYKLPVGGSARSYVIWVDQPDPAWGKLLRYTDLVVFTGSHWFLENQGTTVVRRDAFVEKNRVQRQLDGLAAYRRVLQNLKGFVMNKRNFGGVMAFATYTPSHYGKGASCGSRGPLTMKAISYMSKVDVSALFKQAEVETFRSSKVRLVDITSSSLGRADGHVQLYYGAASNSNTKWDCLHWCLPGVPDTWTDILQFVLGTQLWAFRV